MTDILKRGGKRQTEPFSPVKLEHGVYAALTSVRVPEGQAKDTAHAVRNTVEQWLQDRPEVTSADLRRKASEALAPLHPDATLIYKNFKKYLHS